MTSNSVLILLMFFSYYNMCLTQSVTWQKNNFNNCIKMGQDHFTMKALIKRTTTESFIAKSALFEIKSSNVTIKLCSITDFNNCGNDRPTNECYCSKKTSDELSIVFSIKSHTALIGSVVTVSVPCALKEETLVSKDLVITYYNDTSTVLKIDQEKYDLSTQFLVSKDPVEIEFCCENNLTRCKAFIQRDDKMIDNGSYCASFNETSNSYMNYKMFLTFCNQTIKKGDMLVKIAKQTEVQTCKDTSCKEETSNKESLSVIALCISSFTSIIGIIVAIYFWRHIKKQDLKIRVLNVNFECVFLRLVKI